MDVTLPNGKVIRGVPEGTTKEEIMEKAVAAGIAAAEDFRVRSAPIDVEANRRQAVGQFVESLPWYERMGIGIREPIARAGQRLERAIGIEQTPEQKTGPAAPIPPELSAGADDIATAVGRAVPAVAALGRVPALAKFPALANAPAIVRGAASMAPAAAAAGAYGAATSENPVSGGLSSAAGSIAGSTVAAGLGRVANGIAGRWAERAVSGSDDIAQTLDDFQRLGGRITPGAASGGKIGQIADEALANNAITGSGYASIERNNQTLLNRTLLNALGIGSRKSDKIGPAALQAADDVINAEFNAVAKMVPDVPLQPGIADDVTDLLSERTVKPFLARLQSGMITGRDYMDIRSKLLEITRRHGSDKVDDAWNLIDDLDEAVESVAPQGYKSAYAAARERFKILLAVDKYRRGLTGGDVNALTFDAGIRSVFRKQFTRGAPTLLPETSDLFTVVRALSDPRMASLTGGSPTAKRMMTASAGGMLAGGAAFGDPLTTAAIGTGAYLGGRAYLAAPAGEAARRVGAVGGAALGASAPSAPRADDQKRR